MMKPLPAVLQTRRTELRISHWACQGSQPRVAHRSSCMSLEKSPANYNFGVQFLTRFTSYTL